MNWDSWGAFWDMGGRAAFVWGSYGALLLAVVAELVGLRRARKAALETLRDSQDEHDH